MEILKAFSCDLNIKELQDYKDMNTQYFANKAIGAADKTWDSNKWDDADVDRMLNTKMRKSSKK